MPIYKSKSAGFESEVVPLINQEKFIIIARGLKGENLLRFTSSIIEGGAKLMQIPIDYNAGSKFACGHIDMLEREFGNAIHIGLGTVTNTEQVKRAALCGAKFIATPGTSESVIIKSVKMNIPCISGAITPTEIVRAHKLGATFIKLFPASAIGSAYIRTISEPLGYIKMFAFGGISESSAREFLDAGIFGLGIGGLIANKALISEGRFEEITERTKRILNIIRERSSGNSKRMII